MTSTPLAYAERRMQQRWYDLVVAEQNDASAHVLERMYNAYIRAVDEYNSRSATAQGQTGSTPAAEAQSMNNTSEMRIGKCKKAS